MADPDARLRARAAQEGLAISDDLAKRLLAYFDLLQRWNKKINLTSLGDSDEALDRLLLEPLAAAQSLPRHSTLADLGSGGGSPAIPIALALAAPQLLMVESRSRKAAFLREAAREVQLNAVVEAARFEDVSRQRPYIHGFDVVSMRAVRPDQEALSAAASLLKPGGQIGLFLGSMLGSADLPMPPDLAWRGTRPLLRSTESHLAVLFHVEQP
jgi:16S rRNA (guanine527-N7)-methyltransferase